MKRIIVCIFILSIPVFGNCQTRYSYGIIHRNGATEETFAVTRSPICVEELTATERIISAASFQTEEYYIKDTAKGTDISAVRKGKTIEITGRFKGKQTDKTVSIEDCEWFQSITAVILRITENGAEKFSFGLIRPDNLKLMTFNVSRGPVEKLELSGNMEDVCKYTIRPSGIAGLVVCIKVWARISDGLPVKIAPVSGEPSYLVAEEHM